MAYRNHRSWPTSPLVHRSRDRAFDYRDLRELADIYFGRGPGDDGRFMAMDDPYYDAPDHSPPRRGEGGPEPQAMRPRQRQNMAGQGKQLSITKAMKNLHKVIGKAKAMYGKHRSDFDDETRPVKKYTADALLVKLWDAKFKGKKSSDENDDNDDQDEGDVVPFSKKHEDMTKSLDTALLEAVHSSVTGQSTHKFKLRLDAAGRLQEKVKTASEHIIRLLDKMPKEREHCVSLFEELTMLEALVDPDNETNKKMFKDGEDDADDTDGDAQGQGGGHWDN
ncbi:hypothetical protein ACEPPN_007455 [Leptodophora sp. 'Broadleaf-Isolate-01']